MCFLICSCPYSPIAFNFHRTLNTWLLLRQYALVHSPSFCHVFVPTFADLLTETIRLAENKRTSAGKVVQALKSVLLTKEMFFICVLLLLVNL
jgi:hypothetical protein